MRSEVQVFPDPPLIGGIAQLGEHLLCKQGVRSSNLLTSTNNISGGGSQLRIVITKSKYEEMKRELDENLMEYIE